MKKGVIAAAMIVIMAFSLVSCGTGHKKKEASDGKMKVAMITDSGDITDQGFNQVTYETCKAWAEKNGVECSYFKP